MEHDYDGGILLSWGGEMSLVNISKQKQKEKQVNGNSLFFILFSHLFCPFSFRNNK